MSDLIPFPTGIFFLKKKPLEGAVNPFCEQENKTFDRDGFTLELPLTARLVYHFLHLFMERAKCIQPGINI